VSDKIRTKRNQLQAIGQQTTIEKKTKMKSFSSQGSIYWRFWQCIQWTWHPL